MNVLDVEDDLGIQAEAFQVLLRMQADISLGFIGVDAPFAADGKGQRGGQTARAGAGFDHLHTRADAQHHQDVADVLGVQDLGAARQVAQQVRQRRLDQQERAALVAADLAAPRQADQVVMLDHPAVALKARAGLQGEDEMLVAQADQFDQVAVLRARIGGVPRSYRLIVPSFSEMIINELGPAPGLPFGIIKTRWIKPRITGACCATRRHTAIGTWRSMKPCSSGSSPASRRPSSGCMPGSRPACRWARPSRPRMSTGNG